MEEKCRMVQGEIDTIQNQVQSLQQDLDRIVQATPKEETLAQERKTVQQLAAEVRALWLETFHKRLVL